eukprot:TRINITY_DN3525_c0_g1_i4.p1 TRINITY_DN3525_c0_g1~~TRINITY_DN3525_c0_g1_i4.p1  ORF type:complete len:135 (-),score=18.43 TRINITY_DN3525_c0_g1_i4:3-407(-)
MGPQVPSFTRVVLHSLPFLSFPPFPAIFFLSQSLGLISLPRLSSSSLVRSISHTRFLIPISYTGSDSLMVFSLQKLRLERRAFSLLGAGQVPLCSLFSVIVLSADFSLQKSQEKHNSKGRPKDKDNNIHFICNQ